MEPEVAIILPLHNSRTHIDAMINSLYRSTNVPFRLIIIESESTDGTAEYADELAKKKDNVTVLHTKKGGLPKAINDGIKEAGDLDVFITQDDVIFYRLYGRDWLLDMIEASKMDEIGVVTTVNGGGTSGPDYIDGMRWVGTWAMYLPRETIEKVGLLDENMGPGDDIDYSFRIGCAGMKGTTTEYWVHHHRLTEHGDVDTEAKQKKMAKYFRKKHKMGEFRDARQLSKKA